jgi:hypothetical protein
MKNGCFQKKEKGLTERQPMAQSMLTCLTEEEKGREL